MTAMPRKPLLANLAWATALGLLLTAAYVASYPAAIRWTNSKAEGWGAKE